MQQFYKKYHNHSVEDACTTMSKEAKSFVTAFRNMLKRELPLSAEIINFKAGHYDCSGFIKCNDKYVYVSYNIPRYNAIIDFNKRDVLYRTANHEKDYTGGANHYTSILDLPNAITTLL